jgi:hypothetical protein
LGTIPSLPLVDWFFLFCYSESYDRFARISLKIKMHPPLDRILGPVKEVFLPGSISLAELLRQLTEEAPGLAPYSKFGPKDVQPLAVLVWRQGKLLTLADTLNPADELEMIPMIAGG